MPRSRDFAVLAQAAAVLRVLQRPKTRAAVLAVIEMDPTTAYRLIRTLVSLGWVREVTEVVTPGPGRRAVVYQATVRLAPVRARKRAP